MRRLANGTGTQVPGRMFANLAASAACRDHKICANVCPTGALQAYDDEGATGIAFDAAACIDCGACVRMCVEKALAFAPRTREPLPRRAMRLTRHRTSRCVECEAPCSDASGLCATCRQTRDFAREAFGELFPGGRRSPA